MFVRDCANPVWHSFRNLQVNALEGDFLHINMHDFDDVASELCMTADIPFKDIAFEEKDFSLKGAVGYEDVENCTLRLRRVRASVGVKKSVFLIRHGESKWNEAQEHKNIAGMMHFDHGLNKQGIEQAQSLNSKWKQCAATGQQSEAERRFMNADAVFSSPLTRAASTALVSLQGHPCIVNKGVMLLRTAREIKNLGGLDTVGKKFGPEIAVRVQQQLGDVLGEGQFEQFRVPIDPYDAMSEWWTPVNQRDSDSEMRLHYHDFFATLQYFHGENFIVVGHSLFFQKLCQWFFERVFRKTEFGRQCRKNKLSNAACLHVQVDFTSVPPVITGAELLFETTLCTGQDAEDKMKESKEVMEAERKLHKQLHKMESQRRLRGGLLRQISSRAEPVKLQEPAGHI